MKVAAIKQPLDCAQGKPIRQPQGKQVLFA